MDAVAKYKNRRMKRLKKRGYKPVWESRFDDDDDESGGGSHGNTRIPFGLCKREGIQIDPKWSPKDAWAALEGKGYNAGDVYKELKETGKVPEKPKSPEKPKIDLKQASKTVTAYKKKTREREKVKKALRDAEERLSELEGNLESARASIDYWTKSISDYEKGAGGREKMSENAIKEIKIFEGQIQTLKENEKYFAEQIDKYKGERDSLQERLSGLVNDDEYKEAVDALLSDHPYVKKVREYMEVEEETEDARKELKKCDDEILNTEQMIRLWEEKIKNAKEKGDESGIGIYERALKRKKESLEKWKKHREIVAPDAEKAIGKLQEIKGGAKEKEWKQIYDLSVDRDTIKDGPYDKLDEESRAAKYSGADYKAPRKYIKIPTEEKIIDMVGGLDKTGGSCVSLSFAYAANKGGVRVLDFRGGASWKNFSERGGFVVSACGGEKAMTLKDISEANRMMGGMEEGKEYCLGVGSHAAIVRIRGGKREYLELQDERENNGWKELNDEVLKTRFRAIEGRKYTKSAWFIEVSKLASNPEFISLTGYINTAEDEQRKGAGGSVK